MKTKAYSNIHDSAEHIVSEADGRRSREQILLDSTSFAGGALNAGTVLGQVTATKRYKPHDPAAVDGSQVAKAFLWERREAAGVGEHVRATAHVRDCEVNGRKIFWKAGITDPQKATAEGELATNGSIVRY